MNELYRQLLIDTDNVSFDLYYLSACHTRFVTIKINRKVVQMKRFTSFVIIVTVALGIMAPSRSALAISPRNPYRGFNLSGINYGSMRWERTQRQKQGSHSNTKWSAGNSRTRSSRSIKVDRFRNGLYLSSGEINDGTTQNKAMRTSSRRLD